MEQRENLLGILSLFFEWRKPVLRLSIFATVLTAGITLFLPNYYRSTTVFLAGNPNQARPEILFGKGNIGAELFGSSDDIDRILAIAESNELIDYLVDSFKLYQHYRINPENPKSSYQIRMRFRKFYQVKKTKLNALELSVEDRNPELAAALANAARERINEMGERLIKAGQKTTLDSYEENIRTKSGQIKILGDSLVALRSKYAIYNTGQQSAYLTEQTIVSQATFYRQNGRLESMRLNPRISRDSVAYVEAMVSGLRQELDSLASRMEQLNEGQVLLAVLENQYFSANGQLGEEVERAKLLRAAYQADVPSLILVEHAEVPVVKIRPKRSMIVIASGVLAVLFSILAILLFNVYKEIDWSQLIKRGDR